MTHQRIVLAKRPVGAPTPDCFELQEAADAPLEEGDVRIATRFLSADPYMRGRMNDVKSYVPPFQIGAPIDGFGIGEVVESRNPAFREGDIAAGRIGWESRTRVRGGEGLRKVDPGPFPLSWRLGVLGMPGMTAWVGLLDIGKPKAGETLYVSAASGAVGQIVGQIGKKLGMTTIGSAGSDEKVAFIKEECGFDHAFNYKSVGDLGAALAERAPKGIDVYFENVGGAHLDAALVAMNPFGRIVACGMASQYNLTEPYGVKNTMMIVGKRLRMEGFIVSDHFARMAEFETQMSEWLSAGDIVFREDVAEGLENAPAAFIGMLEGKNFGKQVIKV